MLQSGVFQSFPRFAAIAGFQVRRDKASRREGRKLPGGNW